MNRKSPFSYIPGISTNAVLQVVILSGTAFVGLQLIRVVLLVINGKALGLGLFDANVVSAIALGDVHTLPAKLLTLLTYGWFHNGFWELFSDMLWFYLFASMVQMLVGYKHVIPIFIYSMFVGGLFYYAGQLIQIPIFQGRPYILSPLASIAGIATAALTLSPQYRFYFADRFSLPIILVVAIYGILCLLNIFAFPLMLFLILGGALSGFAYVKLLKGGTNLGAWFYNLFGWFQRVATPSSNAGWAKNSKNQSQFIGKLNDTHKYVNQSKVDAVLDKINLKGYDSLTKEEREILFKAGK
jgi:membrane associated rhomboid family serine protease